MIYVIFSYVPVLLLLCGLWLSTWRLDNAKTEFAERTGVIECTMLLAAVLLALGLFTVIFVEYFPRG